MRIRSTRLVTVLLLVGLSAFVMDFLSPLTPIPIALLAGKFLALSLFGLVSLLLLIPAFALAAEPLDGCIPPRVPRQQSPQVLLALICLLLI